MRLESACGIPEYTNYTDGFVACIDWIFSDADNFSVEKVCLKKNMGLFKINRLVFKIARFF